MLSSYIKLAATHQQSDVMLKWLEPMIKQLWIQAV